MSIVWKGVFPALTTKFTAKDELDLPLFEKNLRLQIASGVDGVILGGSLGEASVLTYAEKERLVKFAIEKVEGAVPIVLNIAESATRDALQLAADAKNWGAEGLMMLPPMRYAADDRETVTYFKTVADSTDLPIMIYNNPVDYKTLVTLDMWEELLECSNIQAVKESTRDVTNVTRMINRFGGRLKILCGVDTLAMEEMLLGADGWVAGLVCAFPAETVAIYRLVKAGRIEEALAIYRWFMPVLELDIVPKLVQYIKLAEVQTGIGSEYVRAPRLTLVGKERERVLSIIGECVATRPALPDYLSISPEKNFA
ncbi:dihydrodipicolinate synthase family protein [Flavitalea sp. BT771]|uniref:dihydrodipicolinate synthase family protein n=1 Tax=Flavitalea sp. BT771 TaxID=3063329 RepID=UPI0026E2A424|nr:dihydrodipicolinate synthase family protein [Flavitalea sp. BT771]MDO6430638.1 dihydrodipicolinate synthase family protein [Flavitalea sp. BT771]MDV6219222.1 dihydrodipicolinate synthase family protein [Flavitalea sp. BT771]